MVWGVPCNTLTWDALTIKPEPKAATATDSEEGSVTFEYVEPGCRALNENVIVVAPGAIWVTVKYCGEVSYTSKGPFMVARDVSEEVAVM